MMYILMNYPRLGNIFFFFLTKKGNFIKLMIVIFFCYENIKIFVTVIKDVIQDQDSHTRPRFSHLSVIIAVVN